jgi:hypothetical protein
MICRACRDHHCQMGRLCPAQNALFFRRRVLFCATALFARLQPELFAILHYAAERD